MVESGKTLLQFTSCGLTPYDLRLAIHGKKECIVVLLAISLIHGAMEIGLLPPQYDASGVHH
jgi:hypothetical protein